ncbi:SRR1-domain-containing protein [Lentinula detonsa]|uniref:SRR1-domain-containing protein n=1 Tax=Lentinula detonsa TaxID=2804962 RepID=A0AA38PUK2_9AGAR|nr:SRR1-domain-containing protein [Lentinula detonsa]
MTFTTKNKNDVWLSSTPSSSRRKQRQSHHHKQHQKQPLSSRLQLVQDKLDLAWLDSCIQILKSCLENRAQVPLANASQRDLYNVKCLGLGSPETSDNARAQLAFLLRTCDAFDIEYTRISIYDPVFTNEDKDLLVQLGMRVLDCESSDSSETHPIHKSAVEEKGTTILFMPHCDLTLYESMLTTNWSVERLRSIVFICNHFDDYIQNNSIRTLESRAPHLLKIAPNVTSIPLPTSPDWPGAFNNTSVQFVTNENLDALVTEMDQKR